MYRQIAKIAFVESWMTLTCLSLTQSAQVRRTEIAPKTSSGQRLGYFMLGVYLTIILVFLGIIAKRSGGSLSSIATLKVDTLDVGKTLVILCHDAIMASL